MKTKSIIIKVSFAIFILFAPSFNSCEEVDSLLGCKVCSKTGEKDWHTCDQLEIIRRENLGWTCN